MIMEKQKILDVAIEMAKDEPVDRISISAICEKAEIPVGTFYQYYDSKDDLLNAAFEIFDRTLDENWLKELDKIDPVEAIREVVIEQTKFTSAKSFDVITEYYRALLQSDSKKAISKNRDYYMAVNRYVTSAQEKGLFTKDLKHYKISEMLIKFVRGNLFDWCLHDGNYDVVKTTEDELDRVLGAFRI